MKVIVYCPKCSSENVSHRRVSPEEVERMTIDEYVDVHGHRYGVAVPAVLIHAEFALICDDCGYSREYIREVGWHGR